MGKEKANSETPPTLNPSADRFDTLDFVVDAYH